ncbi:MBOAT family O-acyltransferase [Aquirufa novilacunae]|jgi:D-alanyl-lipoteichoic acid acyltransferase DltB (MBOAT superfamily)|uniref:MBOAT family O-acyltransferase n=1 Tax=Aquirufa novilacunae TaxID=3139305 RepID=A0ABW8TYC8_9BACT
MQQIIEVIRQAIGTVPFEQLLREFMLYSTKQPWFFTEFSFLFTFGLFLFFYAILFTQNVLRKVYLIAFSLFFYYKSSGPFLGLFLFQIIVDYFFARKIERAEGNAKQIWATIAVLFSLSFLLYFKYPNFLIENTNWLLLTHFESVDLFLPIGISFYTFQSISYLVDVYRGEIRASKNITDYAFYMTFFPHLVAGPIVRAKDFLNQVNSPESPDARRYKESLLRIILGLLKKLLIADYLGKYVDMVFENPSFYTGGENLLGAVAYSFQIYFDFSGYSDIAIGLALLLGYRLKENFDHPYGASNVTEFWRKWHISLSSWLRDYVYIPLGGNRKGAFNTYLFLLITMLVGGFWHGASWKFVAWGAAHGLALALHKVANKHLPEGKWMDFIGGICTFCFVTFCWIFFRAKDFDSALTILNQITYATSELDFLGFWFSRNELAILLITLLVWILIPSTWKKKGFEWSFYIPSIFWFFFLLAALQFIIQFRDALVQPFIYFQF